MIKKEVDALESNDTWELTSLPPNKKGIGCKWVFKVKLKADGSLERLKARLVAKGYTQQYGIDFEETSSLVVKMSTVRCLLALAASKQWNLFQLDINSAFLHGDLTKEIYMKIKQGIPNPQNLVCTLKKSLYGSGLQSLLPNYYCKDLYNLGTITLYFSKIVIHQS